MPAAWDSREALLPSLSLTLPKAWLPANIVSCLQKLKYISYLLKLDIASFCCLQLNKLESTASYKTKFWHPAGVFFTWRRGRESYEKKMLTYVFIWLKAKVVLNVSKYYPKFFAPCALKCLQLVRPLAAFHLKGLYFRLYKITCKQIYFFLKVQSWFHFVWPFYWSIPVKIFPHFPLN